eukprot:gnl/TRDRNA2_/TRDRNA2_210247_c0_seq1.p1 gnl/TRDRNA2_/TRDRNA2_210247_c0~~gnl/TRDRNA2_/TRDRNA2_210247_c0_seq1.p1  ORF type:complete len:108 (+),score=32.21 gnl/TRDRNA2_/TRDRNA2_210247_c0_seq1:39-326(+)
MQAYERSRQIRELSNTLQTDGGAVLFANMGLVKKKQGDLRGAAKQFEQAKQILQSLSMLDQDRGNAVGGLGKYVMQELASLKTEADAAGGKADDE